MDGIRVRCKAGNVLLVMWWMLRWVGTICLLAARVKRSDHARLSSDLGNIYIDFDRDHLVPFYIYVCASGNSQAARHA